MHRENVRKLVEALRSGEYHQNSSSLRLELNGDVVRHCGLGVACDVSGVGRWAEGEGAAPGYVTASERNAYALPLEVQRHYGFIHGNPLVYLPPHLRRRVEGYIHVPISGLVSLARLNDSAGLSHDQLADVLEYNLELQEVESRVEELVGA